MRLGLLLSQSGETADTLAALRYMRAKGQNILSMLNVPESTIARESDAMLDTIAGPEIGVASTKAFTAQLTVLAVLRPRHGAARGTLPEAEIARLTDCLLEIPAESGRRCLPMTAPIRPSRRRIAEARDVLYLGRGACYPIALEGALKLKEISYIHAEGYAAGEMKHGPIALIDKAVPVDRDLPLRAVIRKNRLQPAGSGGARRPDHGVLGRAKVRRKLQNIATETILLPEDRSVRSPYPLRHPGADAGLSRRGAEGHRCRPAAQPRQIRDGGVAVRVRASSYKKARA